MALNTAQDYLYRAFRICGQIRPGYLPSPELLQDGLDEWTLLFDAFNAKRTMNYTMPDYVFPITGPGHGTTGNGNSFGGSGYQIGPTATDFVAPRPVSIPRMNLLMTTTPTPTRIPMSQISMEEWMNIAVVQLVPINVATTFAYDPQFPNGVIWVWPPLNGNSLEIFTWGHLTPPATLSTAFSAPPGYGDLVIHQLAARLLPFCTKDLFEQVRSPQWIRGQAEIIRQRIAADNAPSPRMSNDFMGSSGARSAQNSWNLILTGIPY